MQVVLNLILLSLKRARKWGRCDWQAFQDAAFCSGAGYHLEIPFTGDFIDQNLTFIMPLEM